MIKGIYNLGCIIALFCIKGAIELYFYFVSKYFMLGKKAPCNGRSLDLNKPFNFQPIT